MDLIWRSEKKIKFGADLIGRFLPFCANCAKFSPRQNLSEYGRLEPMNLPRFPSISLPNPWF